MRLRWWRSGCGGEGMAVVMVVRWCGGEGMCGCDGGAVVVVGRGCEAVMVVRQLWWGGDVRL